MDLVALIQARMSSTRLPGKVLEPVQGEPMLARQIERVRRARGVSLVVATSDEPSDDPIAALCGELGQDCFRGPLADVLARFAGAIRGRPGNPIVRLTGDCPLCDPRLIEEVVAAHQRGGRGGCGGVDYTSNVLERHLPDGLDVEVIERSALRVACEESRAAEDREHVTRYLVRHPERFRLRSVRQAAENLAALRWTVDFPEDLAFVRRVYAALYPKNPSFGWRDVLGFSQRRSTPVAVPHEARP